jgi:hypothetical protein
MRRFQSSYSWSATLMRLASHLWVLGFNTQKPISIDLQNSSQSLYFKVKRAPEPIFDFRDCHSIQLHSAFGQSSSQLILCKRRIKKTACVFDPPANNIARPTLGWACWHRSICTRNERSLCSLKEHSTHVPLRWPSARCGVAARIAGLICPRRKYSKLRLLFLDPFCAT